MHKVLIVVGILVLGTSRVQAEELRSFSPKRQEFVERKEEKREQIKENWQEKWESKRDELQDKWQTKRADIAGKHAERLSRRFTFYYERLKAIIGKFETRLVKLEEDDKDTTGVKSKLSEARGKLDEAKSLGDQAIAGFTAIEPEKFEEQKEAAMAARDLANAAREKYREVVRLLREAWGLAKELNE